MTINPKKVVKIFGIHFYKVFNCITKADIEFIKSTKSYIRILKSGLPFCEREFEKALKRLAWPKAPGINGISPNALKALDKRHEKILFNFIQTWCKTDVEYEEWHTSMLSILPKKEIYLTPITGEE